MAEKPRVFVSHSSEDNEFTRRLVADLTAAGADVWVDFDFIRHGDFAQHINEGFAGRQWFVLVLSPSAVRSSWVEREVNAAMSLLTEKRLRGIIGIVAKSVKSSDIPPLWVNLQRYDAAFDYARAVRNVVAVIGLGSAVPEGGSHLIVDPNRSGGYKTIDEAIAAADPGDEIALLRQYQHAYIRSIAHLYYHSRICSPSQPLMASWYRAERSGSVCYGIVNQRIAISPLD